MIRIIGLAIGAALVLGTATASFAESPYGAQAIAPSAPLQGSVRDETPPPYALTGSPPQATSARPACRLDLDHAAPGSAGGQGRSAALRTIRRPRRRSVASARVTTLAR